MTAPAPVGRTAFALGFAGLLPQAAALALIVIGRRDPTDLAWIPLIAGYGLALVYGAVILSFLGGIWWGFAMRRAAGQGRLAALAVVPALVGTGCVGWGALLFDQPWGAAAPVALGLAVIATLPVDRRLVETGEAPANWMRLRVPLSLGLGLLTIASGVVLWTGGQG